ncbi:MAG: hypothetical protein IKR38_03900 [Bacteroidales bacterium]|nr:hypothetical protein [Bacteroidales bacterium]
MKREVEKIGAVVIALFIGPISWAQTEDEAVKAAMYLNGASSPEEIDEGEVERIHNLGKICVNAPGRRARAILSEYQLATLEDYRRQCGDILSWEELALVDGFGKEAVEALKPFLSLYSDSLPGAVDTSARKLHGSALMRVTEKNAGTKVKAEGRIWQLGVASRLKSWPAPNSHSWPDPKSITTNIDWTAHAEVNLGRWDMVLGDYNIRYGQGVGVWSGFSMMSLSTVGAFTRRATGITPVMSFLPSEHRGVAAEYSRGRFTVSTFADLNGTIGGHVSYVSLHSVSGLTVMSGLVSADFSINYKGVNVAGEVGSKGKDAFAGKGVASFKIGNTRFALQGRVLPTRFTGKKNGEYALATGAEWKSPSWRQLAGKTGFGSSVPIHIASLTADASLLPKPYIDPGRKQLRIYGIWQWQISGTMALDARYTGRLRNYEPSRNDIRMDLKYNSGPWLSTTRLEGVYCNGRGLLGYLEGGYKTDNLSAYLRLIGFATEGWSSRIYCYERDAPGSFLVPAYYGQGVVASFFGSLKTHVTQAYRAKICLRSSYAIKPDKPSALSIHLQFQVDF